MLKIQDNQERHFHKHLMPKCELQRIISTFRDAEELRFLHIEDRIKRGQVADFFPMKLSRFMALHILDGRGLLSGGTLRVACFDVGCPRREHQDQLAVCPSR